MGLFGKQNASKWEAISAGLFDIGESLQGGQGTALRNLQARRKEEEAKRQREAYMAQFGEFLGGQSVGEASMTPGIDGSLEGMGPQAMPTVPQAPSQADVIRRLIGAPEGVDTRSLMSLYQATLPPEPDNIEINGALVNRATGKPVYTSVDPLADLKKQELEARIEALKSRGNLYGSQGDYYAARAEQPYAPPRPRASGGAGGGSSPALSAIEAALRKRGLIP